MNLVRFPRRRRVSAAPRAGRLAVTSCLSLLALCVLLARPARAQDEGDAEEKPSGEASPPPAPGKLPLKRPSFPDRRVNVPSLSTDPQKRAPSLRPSVAQAGTPSPNVSSATAVPGSQGAEEDTVVTPSDGPPGLADMKVARGQRCKPLKPDARVTFDFKGDILELVATISKTTCKNFIITNKVRSQKFEIVSPTPITVDEAWRAFLSALEANEFSIVQVGRYYKIIQSADGPRAPVPVYDEDQETPINDRMITKIYKLKHAADVNGVVNYLNIFKSNKGQIHPFAATGTIIATDFGTSIDRIDRVLKEVDQPGALEQLHVVSVEFASAQEIAEKLTQVFEPQKTPGAAKPGAAPRKSAPPPGEGGSGNDGQGSDDEIASVSKILADERTNKLIIIASERSFKQIMSLKKELDVPDDGTDSQIQVVRLRHADAEELASTLASLAQGKPTTARTSRTSGKTGTGGKSPTPPPVPGVPPGAPGTTAQFQGEVKVTADKATNSLVITASKGDYIAMKRVIERLDIARFQVFVEAVIMEISVKNDRQLGFTWHGGFPTTIDGKQSPILFGNQPTQNFSSLGISLNPLLLGSILGFTGVAVGPTLAGTEDLTPGGVGIPAIGVVMQALQTSNNVNVVSTPTLLTLDNEEAEIQVNEKRPFPSGLSLGGGLGNLAGLAGTQAAGALGNIGGLGLGSVSFNREDVGLTLKLKPQISDEDYVRLEIDQELSDVAGVDAATGQTVTSKRAAKTVVVVRNQDSVVIGGLVRDRDSIDESKVPLFGDIPLIGWLFKRQVKLTEKVNLVLVLTPYIIRGPQDFRTIYERQMEARRDFVNRYHGVSPDYEADIDWSRKRGPLASYRLAMRKELMKAENEGPGSEDQTIIGPDETRQGGTIGPIEQPKSRPLPETTPAPTPPPPPPETPDVAPEPDEE